MTDPFDVSGTTHSFDTAESSSTVQAMMATYTPEPGVDAMELRIRATEVRREIERPFIERQTDFPVDLFQLDQSPHRQPDTIPTDVDRYSHMLDVVSVLDV